MYYERLSLEVVAARLQWEVVSPPILRGLSGVTHKFDFVAVDGKEKLVFDIYDRLNETDVIKTFIKKLDTGASAYIICLSDKAEEGAGKLAAEYRLKILPSKGVEYAFSTTETKSGLQDRSPVAA